MPRLSTKAAAELLNIPAYEPLRILTEQKYPKQQPQVFRTPFYQPALRAIRDFYKTGNEPAVIAEARAIIDRLSLESRRRNNHRVLDSFEQSSEYMRALTVRPNKRFNASVGAVEIKLSPDLLAHEDGQGRVLYYNFRAAGVEPQLARTTIEIAHWILEENGHEIPIRTIEYVDLTNGRRLRTRTRRATTLRRLRANARVIEALWDSI
jgi:hypothetical protein